MKMRPLQEISKVLAGVVLADIISMVWLAQQGLLPATFFGITVDPSMVVPGVIFDLCLFIIFVHYGWHVGKIPRLRERAYLLVAGIIFTIVTAAHVLRIFVGGNLVIIGWQVPLWLSWVGVVLAAYLAYTSFVFAARVQNRR